MDFNSSNLTATWKKWRQDMESYLTAMMIGNTEEEKYNVFLFLIGEQGRDIFNTIEWDKKVDAQRNKTEADITVKMLFKRFEEYCLPKKNLVVERRKFFWKNQHDDETFDQFMTELRNVASTCEFVDLHESLLLYKVVDRIRSGKIRDALLRKGVDMTLEKAINICRNEEIIKMQMKEMNNEKEVGDISRNQKWKKAQKKKGGSDDRQKKENKKRSTQTMDGKGCKFCGRIHKPRVSCIWLGMPQVQKEEPQGKLLYDKENTRSIYQV